MIKPFTRTLALLLFAAVTFTACKKNKEDTLAVTNENLAATYTLGSIKVAVNGHEEDITHNVGFDDCELDDQYTLRADNTYKYEDVGTKCDQSDGYEDDWSLENNVIKFDGWEGPIKKLTNKVLVIEQIESGLTYTITFNRK